MNEVEMGLATMPFWFYIATGVPISLMTYFFMKVVVKTWKLETLEKLAEQEGEEEPEETNKSFYDHSLSESKSVA